MSAEGRIVFTVWPAHIGFAKTQYELVPHDRRTQIQWRPEGGTVVGSAKCWVPAGTYECLQYFHDLDKPNCGVAGFDHPFVQPVDDWVVVDPIRNNDPVNVGMSGQAR